MRLRDSELKGLPVETETGESLGKIAGLTVDVGTHMVIQYLVTKSRRLAALLPSELSVHYSQVVSVDESKMVVRGNMKEIAAQAESFQQQIRDAAASAVTSATVSRMSREKA